MTTPKTPDSATQSHISEPDLQPVPAHSPRSMTSNTSIASLASLSLSPDTDQAALHSMHTASSSNANEISGQQDNPEDYGTDRTLETDSDDTDSEDDPLGITQLNHDFEALIDQIGARVRTLADQALKSAQYQANVISQQIEGPGNDPLHKTTSRDQTALQDPNDDSAVAGQPIDSTHPPSSTFQKSSVSKSASSFFSSKPQQPLTADEEIKNLKELMKQCDTFEMDFIRLRQIADIVQEFRERIETIEAFVKS